MPLPESNLAVLALAILTLAAAPAAARSAPGPAAAMQEPGQDQATLQKLRQEKLSKPVFQQPAWFTDFDKARGKAKKDKKLLLVYFTRSYAH
jgi:hypothetical protein